MRPSDIFRSLVSIIPTRQSMLLLGAPGLGKSSVAFQAAAQIYNGPTNATTVTGLPDENWFVVIRAMDKDPVDLKGLPFVKDGKTQWSEPDLIGLLRPEGGVICIEELPQALPAVQCVLRELLLDHRIGGHKIPDTWTVIATGNRVEDKAGAGRLLSHVASSVIVMTMEISVEDWQGWAVRVGIKPDVRSFINFRPDLLHNFEPSRMVNADPRGWESVSIISEHVPDDLLHQVCAGKVGDGPAAEYVGFRRIYTQLPDPRHMLDNAATCKIPTELAVVYAMVGSLTEAVRNNPKAKDMAGIVTISSRLSTEHGVLLFRDAMGISPAHRGMIVAAPGARKWLAANAEFLIPKGGA